MNIFKDLKVTENISEQIAIGKEIAETYTEANFKQIYSYFDKVNNWEEKFDLSKEEMLYKSIYEALQWIRYNGVSLASLLRITEILCPEGLVKITSITVAQNKRHWIVHYTYNDASEIDSKTQRVFLFEYLIGLKFKQCALVQSEGE